MADEPTLYSQQGKYTLSPGIVMTVAPDESSHLLKATLTFAGGGGNSVTLNSARPDEPFLLCWDAAKQTLWWATAQNIGNWDVQNPHASHGMTSPRTSPVVRDDQIIGIPAVFVAALARTLPRRP